MEDLNEKSYRIFLKKIFAFIACICPTYEKHLTNNFSMLSEVWLSELKKFTKSEIETAFYVFTQKEFKRFPQTYEFSNIVRNMQAEKERNAFFNPPDLIIKEYQNLCNKLFGLTNIDKLLEIFAKLHKIQCKYSIEALEEKMNSKQKSIYVLKRLFVRFRWDLSSKNTEQNHIVIKHLQEIEELEKQYNEKRKENKYQAGTGAKILAFA